MPRENRVYPSYPLSDIDSSLFWMKWRDISTRSSFSNHISEEDESRSSLKERKSLCDDHSSPEKKDSKDEHRNGESNDSHRQKERTREENYGKPLCREREERKKRESQEDDLTCDIDKLQRQERFLSQHTCPVCGLPSAKKGDDSDGKKDTIDGEKEREEGKKEKDRKDRELRVKKKEDKED